MGGQIKVLRSNLRVKHSKGHGSFLATRAETKEGPFVVPFFGFVKHCYLTEGLGEEVKHAGRIKDIIIFVSILNKIWAVYIIFCQTLLRGTIKKKKGKSGTLSHF